jgi:hypothetical protein
MSMRLLRVWWTVRYAPPWLAVWAATMLVLEAGALAIGWPAHRWASLAGWSVVLVLGLRRRRAT